MYRDITVMVVEDDHDVREMICRALATRHFGTLRADSVQAALDQMAEADIMVLDLKLPDGDGRLLLDRWNRKLDIGPAVIVSAYVPERNALLCEAWNVVEKPFDVDMLIRIVERYSMVVRGTRCCQKVRALEKRMVLMWIAIAALGGTQFFLPLIQRLIGLL